jgi:hypothetical protein
MTHDLRFVEAARRSHAAAPVSTFGPTLSGRMAIFPTRVLRMFIQADGLAVGRRRQALNSRRFRVGAQL